MTKTKLLTLVAIILSGCNLALDYTIPYNPCEGMTEYEIGNWIRENIVYTFDWEAKEHASLHYEQSPRETMRLREGDCEDFAILYVYLVYLNTGVKYDVTIIHDIQYGLFGFHVLVNKYGVLFEPISNIAVRHPDTITILKTTDYDTALYFATNAGTKSLE